MVIIYSRVNIIKVIVYWSYDLCCLFTSLGEAVIPSYFHELLLPICCLHLSLCVILFRVTHGDSDVYKGYLQNMAPMENCLNVHQRVSYYSITLYNVIYIRTMLKISKSRRVKIFKLARRVICGMSLSL